MLGGARFGSYAELVVTKQENLVPLPDDWSFEEGAALPVNYMTAYAGLVRFGSLRKGERVLIHAAAGGVGIAAIQIAKLVGAGEIYGTASPGKHDAIKEIGVDHPIDYTSKDFAKEVRRISGEKTPLDVIMDAVGGGSFRKGYGLLRAGGRLVMFGASSVTPGEKRDVKAIAKMLATTPVFHPMQLMPASKAVIGLNMLTLWDEFEIARRVPRAAAQVDRGRARSDRSSPRRSRSSAAPTPTASCRSARTSARSFSRCNVCLADVVSDVLRPTSPSPPPSGGIARGGRLSRKHRRTKAGERKGTTT